MVHRALIRDMSVEQCGTGSNQEWSSSRPSDAAHLQHARVAGTYSVAGSSRRLMLLMQYRWSVGTS